MPYKVFSLGYYKNIKIHWNFKDNLLKGFPLIQISANQRKWVKYAQARKHVTEENNLEQIMNASGHK